MLILVGFCYLLIKKKRKFSLKGLLLTFKFLRLKLRQRKQFSLKKA